jgi:hypothetical protein
MGSPVFKACFCCKKSTFFMLIVEMFFERFLVCCGDIFIGAGLCATGLFLAVGHAQTINI